ncbi:hypothetical protein ACFWZ3_16605 [Frateuria sp. GZRR35]|uniref:hypothetical protein n=1 Tax=Frateuria sp. GZRR35 TaxID=3351536 RepID=UPI003EDC2371
MIKILATAAAILLASACSAEVRSHYPTVSFVETDSAGKEVRELKFELTDRPANTCISGDWKQAAVLTDVNGYTKSPAYIMADGKLEVLLINTMCDAYDSYAGAVTGNTFSGEHVAYGLDFSKTLGKVSGAYSTP